MADTDEFPFELNLTMERGAFWELEAVHTEDDGVTPINFTGCTGLMQLKRSYRDASVDKVFSTANTLFSLNASGVMNIQNDDSDDFCAQLTGVYVYDIFIFNPSGQPEKYYKGTLTVNPSVSV